MFRLVLPAVFLFAVPHLGPTLAHAQTASQTTPAPAAQPAQAPAPDAEEQEEEEPDLRPRSDNSGVFNGFRIQGFAQFGLLGQARLSPRVDTPGDIHFAYGFELRMTYPFRRYFVAGGTFGFRRFRTDGSEAAGYGRSTFFEAAALLQPRIPITLKNGKLLELAITIPVGLGMMAASQGWAEISGGAGLAIGGLGSIQYFIAPRLSWTFEAGWIQHMTWHQVETDGSPYARARMNSGQLVFRVGLGLRI